MANFLVPMQVAFLITLLLDLLHPCTPGCSKVETLQECGSSFMLSKPQISVIRGIVVDENGQALEGATVILRSVETKKIVIQSITDPPGKFVFPDLTASPSYELVIKKPFYCTLSLPLLLKPNCCFSLTARLCRYWSKPAPPPRVFTSPPKGNPP
jgi:hypothetical protein